MRNEFYVKREVVEKRLGEYGFAPAGEFLSDDITIAQKVAFWFKEGYIIRIKLSGAMSQLVRNIAVYQIQGEQVKWQIISTLENINQFLKDWKGIECSNVISFLDIFEVFYSNCHTQKEKIVKVLSKEKEFPSQFRDTFSVQFEQLSAENNTVTDYSFPEFVRTTNDKAVCKIVEILPSETGDVVVVSNKMGSDNISTIAAEHFLNRADQEIDKKEILSIVECMVDAFSGIFEKKAIKEYIKMASQYLANADILEERLVKLPPYHCNGNHLVRYEKSDFSPKFEMAKTHGYDVILYLNPSFASLHLDNFFESQDLILFEPQYVAKYLGEGDTLADICDVLYNVLSWFPNEYGALSDVVLEYLEYFASFHVDESSITSCLSMPKNPNYLKSYSKENKTGGLQGISAFDSSSGLQGISAFKPSSGLQGISAFKPSSMFSSNNELRITSGMNTLDMVTVMSGGNPGAIQVLMKFLNSGEVTNILALDSLHVYDSEIWMLYKDVCGENLDTLNLVLQNNSFGKLSEEDIHAQITKCKPFEKLLTTVELHADFMQMLNGVSKTGKVENSPFSMPTDEEDEE